MWRTATKTLFALVLCTGIASTQYYPGPGGSGGGGGVSSGTYASLPGSSSTGHMYVQTDGPYSFVANGSGGWQPFVPGSNGGAVTLPVASGYSWSNQPSGATVSATSGGEILTVVGAGGDHFATRKVEAAPSAPWSLQAAYQMSPWSPNYTNSGIMAYNASTGKGIVCGIGAGSGRALQFQHLTSYTTVSSNPFAGGYQSGTLQWIKMVNDATNIKCYESTTGGATWNLYYSETVATYYTGSSVDTVGYTMDINVSTVSATLWLLHWLQGTT